MRPAKITITLEEGKLPRTELLITMTGYKTWYRGDKVVDYIHPLSRGLVELNLFDEDSGTLACNLVGGGCLFEVAQEKREYYKDKIRLVYNRYLEVSEIQQLVCDPMCMTYTFKAPIKSFRNCCCCSNFSCPVCGWRI